MAKKKEPWEEVLKDVFEQDQSEQSIRALAKFMTDYYRALLQSGMPDLLASQMIVSLQLAVLGMGRRE